MSSQTTIQGSTPSLPRPYILTLIEVLREANERYSQLAASVRKSLRPTHHARKRAIALKLSVNIKNARKLDQRQVSSIPLPILEHPVSPPLPAIPGPERSLPVVRIRPPLPGRTGNYVRIVAPIPVRAAPPRPAQIQVQTQAQNIGMAVVGREREIKRLSRPVPVEVPSRSSLDLISAVSITVGSPNSSLAPNAKSHSQPESQSQAQSRLSWLSLSSGSGDDSSDEERVRCAVVFPSMTSQDSEKDTMKLNVPIDVSRLSWSSDLSYRYGSDSNGSSSSGSSSSSSSHELATPVTENEESPRPKLMIRIKRKSSTSFVEADDEVVHEKRPKYERKHWTRPVRI